MIRNTLLAVIAIAAATSANAAAPSNDTAAPSVSVSFHDLNLAAATDVEKFKRRIERAAARVCIAGSDLGGAHYSLAEDRMIANCRRIALVNVQPQVVAAIQHASNLASNDAPIVVAAG